LLFLATLADVTKQMKLGTGVINLPHSHPVIVASYVAMLDHVLEGRLIMGIGPGIHWSDAEAMGVLDQDRNAMFVEAIDQILAIWAGDPPYGLKGKYWNITTERTIWPEIGLGPVAKPYQKPHERPPRSPIRFFSECLRNVATGRECRGRDIIRATASGVRGAIDPSDKDAGDQWERRKRTSLWQRTD
jgi:hypothetical protein